MTQKAFWVFVAISALVPTIMLLAVPRRFWPWAFVVYVFAFSSVMLITLKQMDKRRAAALSQLAIEMGFRYDHDGQPLDEATKAVVPLFHWGYAGAAHHILSGTAAGVEVAIFDYRSQGIQTAAAAYRFDPGAPVFQLWPKKRLPVQRPALEALRRKEVRFDSSKGFSDRYLVSGPDENAIRAFFNPGMLAYFESLDRPNKWHIETGGGWILFYIPGKQPKPEEMRPFFGETSAMYSAIKSYMSGSAFGQSA